MNLRMLPLGTLLAGLCLFFMPFFTVSCSQQPLVSFAGTDLAFGLRPTLKPAFKQMEKLSGQDLFSDTDTRPGRKSKAAQEMDDNRLNGLVTAAFALGLIAAILAASYGRGIAGRALPAGIMGALAALLLIAARLHLAHAFEEKAAEQTMGLITLEFGPGFYGPVIAFGLGAFMLLTGAHFRLGGSSGRTSRAYDSAPIRPEDEEPITD